MLQFIERPFGIEQIWLFRGIATADRSPRMRTMTSASGIERISIGWCLAITEIGTVATSTDSSGNSGFFNSFAYHNAVLKNLNGLSKPKNEFTWISSIAHIPRIRFGNQVVHCFSCIYLQCKLEFTWTGAIGRK